MSIFRIVGSTAIVISFLVPQSGFAQTSRAFGAHDGLSSGESGAQLGTTIYNTFNPDTPLPPSRGSVLQDTAKGLGAGKSVGEAWKDAAEDNSGVRTMRSGGGNSRGVR